MKHWKTGLVGQLSLSVSSTAFHASRQIHWKNSFDSSSRDTPDEFHLLLERLKLSIGVYFLCFSTREIRVRRERGREKRKTSNENSNAGDVGGYSVEALEPMFAKSGLRKH